MKSPATPSRSTAARSITPVAVPNILESLRADCLSGILSLDDAARELLKAGWMNFIDLPKASRLLRLS